MSICICIDMNIMLYGFCVCWGVFFIYLYSYVLFFGLKIERIFILLMNI